MNGLVIGACPTRNDCHTSRFVPLSENEDWSPYSLFGLHVFSKEGFFRSCRSPLVEGESSSTAVSKTGKPSTHRDKNERIVKTLTALNERQMHVNIRRCTILR